MPSSVNPDTYCGIYCGACSVLVHGSTGGTDGFHACLGGVPKEELVCGGCKSGTVYAGCRTCAIRDCAVEKGVGHCVECSAYPCKTYSRWQLARRILPHIREAVSSLEAIKSNGTDAWLGEQKKRWSCPGCSSPISWYATECPTCGRKLGSEAYAMAGLRKLLCRFILPAVYRKGKRADHPRATPSN